MKQINEIIGWYGTVAIISAYALNSFGVLKINDFAYQFLNLTGAIGIILISAKKKAWQPATLNTIWAVIAAFSLIKIIFKI